MPQLIKPANVKVTTKDGEVHMTISLELTINLNAFGIEKATPTVEAQSVKQEVKKQEKADILIPDFGTTNKIEFGKKG